MEHRLLYLCNRIARKNYNKLIKLNRGEKAIGDATRFYAGLKSREYEHDATFLQYLEGKEKDFDIDTPFIPGLKVQLVHDNTPNSPFTSEIRRLHKILNKIDKPPHEIMITCEDKFYGFLQQYTKNERRTTGNFIERSIIFGLYYELLEKEGGKIYSVERTEE